MALSLSKTPFVRTPLPSLRTHELASALRNCSYAKSRCLATTVRSSASDKDVTARPPLKMTFEQYRKLSKKIKNVSRLPGAIVGLASISGSMSVAVYLNPTMFQAPPEEIQLIYGMDPLMVTAFAGLGCGVVGYLVTSMSVAAIWRRSYNELKQWDQNFLSRLDKHRYMEVNKFEDDYYGDKIKTLSDYRQWVRKQHKRKEDAKARSSSSDQTSSSSTDASPSSNQVTK